MSITTMFVAETAKVIGKKAIEESGPLLLKISERIPEGTLKKAAETSGEIMTNTFGRHDISVPPSGMENYKLYQEMNYMKTNPEVSPALVNKTISESSNIKGQLGEVYAQKNSEDIFGGVISKQMKVGNNRLDLFIEKSTKNAKLTEVVSDGEGLSLKKSYFPSGKKVSLEVKNGSKKYFKSEIANNHLLEQVKAGKSVADYSLVGVQTDVLREIAADSTMIDAIKSINDAGGKIVALLPPDNIQIVNVLGGFKS